MIVVSNTSPLSNLAIVGHLWLLQRLYQRVLIPQAVSDELTNAIEEDEQIATIFTLDWIEIRPTANLTLVATLENDYNLDPGESEAIALAIELNADVLLIDERLGRHEATSLGLSTTGILGILLVSKTRGLIPAIKPVMDALINNAGFRVSKQLYVDILNAAGE